MRNPPSSRGINGVSSPKTPQYRSGKPSSSQSSAGTRARNMAMPHSSGDTVPMDVAYPQATQHSLSDPRVKAEDMPIRGTQQTATPAPTHASTPFPTTETGLGLLGSSTKVLLHAIRDLERHGIDTTASIPLPKIVVVGDQSAGKSSLIEAISEITVPRDAGTCTRCVLHITLRNEPDTEWRCDISLVQKYYYAPDTSSSYLYPWSEMDQEITPLETVRNKHDLENAIRRAQMATLNPSQDPRSFARSSRVEREVEFSPNIVSLEIVAPGLPDLSFYDLPGIISQSHDGSRDTVHLVKSLAESYAQQENCIIMLAIAMESDINNSMASALIDEIPGASDRTIGVLTKPDRLQAVDKTSVSIWMDVLLGRKFRKGHGYFVVKQPGPDELKSGISHFAARGIEDDFFKSPSWISRFGALNAARLGTRNLQQDLSNKLATLILNVMPTLRAQIDHKQAAIEAELEQYPEPPLNALQAVNQAIVDFSHDVTRKMQTQPTDLSDAWKAIKMEFHASISGSPSNAGQLPTLDVKTNHILETNSASNTPVKKAKPQPAKLKRPKEVIALTSDDEDDETPCPTPAKKVKAEPCSARRDSVFVNREASVVSSVMVRDREFTPIPLRKKFTLDEILNTLNAFNTSGIPDGIELKAVDHMILLTLAQWHVPLEVLVGKVRTALTQSLLRSMNRKVNQWRTTQLFREMTGVYTRFLERHLDSMKTSMYRTLELERAKPITCNEKLMNMYATEEQATLKNARLKWRYRMYLKDAAEKAGKEPVEPIWNDKTRKEAITVLEADTYDREIHVMARIRAYYQIASIRFVDQVVQAVEAELLLKCQNELQSELVTALRVHDVDGFANANRLVADDPQREQRRAVLKERLNRLSRAANRIAAMHNEFNAEVDVMDDEI